MVQNLLRDFDYDYEYVITLPTKLQVAVVDVTGFTDSFRENFSNRIETVINNDDFEKFGFDSKPDIIQSIAEIRVVWKKKAN